MGDEHNDLTFLLDEAIRLAELGDETSLRYACLQVRISIEAFFYRLIPLYRAGIPDDVLRGWRPRDLIDAIIDCDPMASFDNVVTVTPHRTTKDSTPVPIIAEQKGLRNYCATSTTTSVRDFMPPGLSNPSTWKAAGNWSETP